MFKVIGSKNIYNKDPMARNFEIEKLVLYEYLILIIRFKIQGFKKVPM